MSTATISKRSTTSHAKRGARVTSKHVPDERQKWYEVTASDLRPGDLVRFKGHNGRLVEGRLERLPDGSLWCQFETITPALTDRWARLDTPPERQGMPRVSGRARALLDGIATLDPDAMMRMAVTNGATRGEAYDALLESRTTQPWAAVWEHTRGLIRARVEQVGPAARPYEEGAADTICAAVVALAFTPPVSYAARVTLLAGYVEAFPTASQMVVGDALAPPRPRAKGARS